MSPSLPPFPSIDVANLAEILYGKRGLHRCLANTNRCPPMLVTDLSQRDSFRRPNNEDGDEAMILSPNPGLLYPNFLGQPKDPTGREQGPEAIAQMAEAVANKEPATVATIMGTQLLPPLHSLEPNAVSTASSSDDPRSSQANPEAVAVLLNNDEAATVPLIERWKTLKVSISIL